MVLMAPPSDAGSVRPIDFEDAHIQHVEVDVDEQNNLQSYLATLQGEGAHLSAGGELAYRVHWSGEPLRFMPIQPCQRSDASSLPWSKSRR